MSFIFDTVLNGRLSDLTSSGTLDSISLRQSTLNYGEVTSLFLFLSSYVGSQVDGFISNISLGSSYGWYFRVDQFELIFLGLLMLQLFLLRYIEILPINMNNLFIGDPSGRRRKRSGDMNVHKICRRDELAESMLKLLRKLDDGDCFPFALCELGKLVKTGNKLPEDFNIPHRTKKLINALKTSGDYRKKNSKNCDPTTALTLFEEAVAIGHTDKFLNGTVCGERYPACPLSSQEVIHHVRLIAEADMLS